MAREESMDMIPVGLNVLVVDDNPTCLRILRKLLGILNYIVTIATEAVLALQILRENKGKFDIVITDVHMPKMNGLDLLECIGLELDIPVIMLSANDDPRLVMKGVRYGAVDYLVKPVRLEELKNIWQHVVRRRQLNHQKNKNVEQPILMVEAESAIPEESQTKKRKENENNEDDNEEERGSESTDLVSKKARVIWSSDLHKKFVAAVDMLGTDKAFPKKILEIMSVEGISRENVASHLQKYRLYLKRMKSPGPYCGILPQTRTSTSSQGDLTQTAMDLGINLSQNQNVGQFQNQLPSLNSQSPVVGTLTLMDYSRKMESNWSQRNELSSTIADAVSHLETALAGSSLNPSSANLGGPNATTIGGQGLPNAQNFDYNFNTETQRWHDPMIGSSNQSFGVESSAQVDSNIDTSYSDDILDTYIVDDPHLQADFDRNNGGGGGGLEDIIRGFLDR